MRIPVTLAGPFLALGLSACSTAPPSPETDEVVACESPRPEVCTMEYDPVCGILGNQQRREYSNGCSACADSAVTGYIPEPCAGSRR